MEDNRVKILLVDDDQEDYIITHDILSEIEGRQFEVQWVAKYDAAQEVIATGQFDVCLVDYRLGGRNGLDLITEAIGNGCKIPMILLTGRGDREVDIKAMEAGASDYLVKSRLDPFLLERSIRYSMQRRQEQESKEALEQELLQFQKMESIGRLAGGVAHELNNLLTPIIGYTQLMMMKPTSENDRRSNLEQINRASVRASDLVKQLLTFSHRQVIEPKIIQLNDLISDVGGMLRRLIDESIEIVVIADPTAKPVKADPSQMEQILINLTVNARDAMPNGGKITIETSNVTENQRVTLQHQATDSGDYVMLAVSDNGIGMTDDVKSHIFEPFFTTKEQGKGTGLGLATCYGIANQIGGQIEVVSNPGQGTSFRIYLPSVTEEISKSEPNQTYDEMPSGTETILLVEDEPLVRLLTNTILKGQGYAVWEASNGEEALRVAEQHAGEQIDLLVSDVVMPQMGGVELSKRFRSLYPETPVLLMSGYNDEITSSDGPLSDRIGFLAKPFKPVALAQKARALLDQR